MELGLNGKTAVVTGASRGIGLAIVRALVAEGVHVVAGALHSSEALEALVQDGVVTAVHVDLSTPDGPAQLVQAAGERVDVLVNNVGAAGARLGGFLEVTDEQWLSSINLNLMAAVRASRAALPLMLAAGHGVIVTTSSVNAYLPDPRRDGLRRGQGGPIEFLQGIVQGGRPARHPGQHREPRAGGHRPLDR
jgi:NAD(P)-dependent dehydrogenase (short-subunit alcohol dehydrogenase family)